MSRALSNDTIEKFLSRPNVEQYRKLQQLAFENADHEPMARTLIGVEASLRTANPTVLLQQLEQLPWSYQICPRFHYVEARIRELLGEIESMEAAVSRLKGCLTAICETGEGTQKDPFHVAFLTDIDDVVRSFGEQVRYQQPVVANSRQFDVVTAHSGQEFWFDVTRIASTNGPIGVDGSQSDVNLPV